MPTKKMFHASTLVSFCATCALGLAVVSAQSPPQPKQAEEETTLNCRDGAQIRAEQYMISVPENRRKQDSRNIKVAFKCYKHPVPNENPPIFFLAGGPGASGINIIDRFVKNGGKRFFDLVGCDVIAIDQRGVGFSVPNLDTDTLYGLSPTEPGKRESILRKIRAVCRNEAARWRAQGVDLTGYNTVESADDVNAIRQFLDYPKITLWGASYGSHLAMSVIRRHGEFVSHALLEGPEGPDHTFKLPIQSQEALRQISALVAQDPVLNQQIPDLLVMLEEVLDRLQAKPVYVTVDGQRVGVSKFDVQVLIAMKIGTIKGSGDTIPAMVKDLHYGQFEQVAKELMQLRKEDGIYSVMSMMMDCSSGISDARNQQLQTQADDCLLGDVANWPTPYLAEAWGAQDLGDEFRSKLTSPLPILFVVGDMDSRTPVSNARELMKGLPNAELVVVKNVGHNDLPMGMPSLRDIWGQFLSTGKATSTTLTAPPVKFALPQSVKPKGPEGSIAMTAEQLSQHVGEYRFENGMTLRIRIGEDRLIATIPGKGDFNLWPNSKGKFIPDIDQIPALQFKRDHSNNVIGLEGNGITAKRLATNAGATFVDLPNMQLDLFVGRFDLGKLGDLVIRRKGKRLTATIAGQRKLEVKPTDRYTLEWLELNARLKFSSDYEEAEFQQDQKTIKIKKRPVQSDG